mgnify:CR=1 FL=1
MPMIRYDTGDVGARVKVIHNGRERYAVGSFGGRIVDSVKDFNGNPVSPHAITNLMWNIRKLEHFKFVQKAKGKYQLILNVQKNDINEKELIQDYKKNLWTKIQILLFPIVMIFLYWLLVNVDI